MKKIPHTPKWNIFTYLNEIPSNKWFLKRSNYFILCELGTTNAYKIKLKALKYKTSQKRRPPRGRPRFLGAVRGKAGVSPPGRKAKGSWRFRSPRCARGCCTSTSGSAETTASTTRSLTRTAGTSAGGLKAGSSISTSGGWWTTGTSAGWLGLGSGTKPIATASMMAAMFSSTAAFGHNPATFLLRRGGERAAAGTAGFSFSWSPGRSAERSSWILIKEFTTF